MRQRPRALAFGGLICVSLLLGGCAAGSPAVVVPAAPDTTQVTAPVVSQAAPEIAVVDETIAPETAAIGDAVADTSSAPEVGIATASKTSSAQEPAPETGTIETASFAQDVPAVETPPEVVQPDPETAPVVEPATTDPATAQTMRPPPPPDPGDGMSQIIEGGANGRLEVALTFDAGADTGYGAEILDLLRDEGIAATFGMTGVWAQANPDLVRRMAAEGHQIINHTWDHASLTGANTGLPPQSPEAVAQSLADTEAVVWEATGGYEMRPYFRPPYGDYDATSLGYLSNNGYYLTIWWTCDSHGWAGWGAQEIIDYCTTNLVEDEILLLHVGAAAVGDFEALPGLIQSFRDSGYAFVTVEQMLQP
jgi:peptidoglycan/xylan/chitin deacetylase (PgdA/CDA1 family)